MNYFGLTKRTCLEAWCRYFVILGFKETEIKWRMWVRVKQTMRGTCYSAFLTGFIQCCKIMVIGSDRAGTLGKGSWPRWLSGFRKRGWFLLGLSKHGLSAVFLGIRWRKRDEKCYTGNADQSGYDFCILGAFGLKPLF